MNIDKQAFYDKMTAFVAEMAGAGGEPVDAQLITPEANLFDLGLVTSFSMIRLIVHAEELTGVPLDPSATDPEQFYTLERLHGLMCS